MGFATASVTDVTETLYIAGDTGTSCGAAGGRGLGTLDLVSGTLTPVGPFSGALVGQNAELTGTGDGRLFGFFDLSPVRVAEIDRKKGTTSSGIQMSGMQCPQAYAFSFWGGAFYMYVSDEKTNSRVYRYDVTTGQLDSAYILDAGFIVAGAGVSTCAPTTAPTPH
jgi:hypothetical protein